MVPYHNSPGRQQGASLIEFALVLPVFLALILGILFFGIAFVTQQAVNYAAESGAEAAVSVDPAVSDTEFRALARDQANKRVSRLLSFFPGSPPPVEEGEVSDGICVSATGGDDAFLCVTSNDGHRTVTLRLAPEFNSLWPGFPHVLSFLTSQKKPQTVSATGSAIVAESSNADGG